VARYGSSLDAATSVEGVWKELVFAARRLIHMMHLIAQDLFAYA
jgi:hypothetical protein